MGHGTSKGIVDEKFKKRITQLEEQARKMAEYYRDLGAQTKPRPWNTPDELKSRDLMDVPALHNPCWDRNKINETYSEQVLAGPGKTGGTTGDLIAMKWQADFLATEERAFRLRHASYARCAALMHGRLNGHGREKVSVFSFFKDAVENMIEVGKAQGAAS